MVSSKISTSTLPIILTYQGIFLDQFLGHSGRCILSIYSLNRRRLSDPYRKIKIGSSVVKSPGSLWEPKKLRGWCWFFLDVPKILFVLKKKIQFRKHTFTENTLSADDQEWQMSEMRPCLHGRKGSFRLLFIFSDRWWEVPGTERYLAKWTAYVAHLFCGFHKADQLQETEAVHHLHLQKQRTRTENVK